MKNMCLNKRKIKMKQKNNFPMFNGCPIDTAIDNDSFIKETVTQIEPTDLTLRNIPIALMGWYELFTLKKVSGDECKIAYCKN